MKYKLFDNEGKIELIEVSVTRNIPSYLKGETPNKYEDTLIQTKVYTDGKIVKQEEPKVEQINEYFIDGKKYTHHVDKKTTRTIYLKDFTYAIVYTTGREYITVGNIYGDFFVTKDVEIFLKSKKDISALRKARKTMKKIESGNASINCKSLYEMMLTTKQDTKNLQFEEIKDNVYTLKK